MNIKIFQVDAFTRKMFSGNPAAVCPLERFLPDTLMQSIADENRLPETAFIVPKKKGEYTIRWFSPTEEVSLCGHATLAAAYVVFNFLERNLDKVVFDSMSGMLEAIVSKESICLTLPSRPSYKIDTPLPIKEAASLQKNS